MARPALFYLVRYPHHLREACTGADSLPSGVGAWKVHPAFSRNSVTKAQIYLGAYEGYYDGVSKLQSVAGVTPTTGASPIDWSEDAYRSAAELRGTGWEQMDYLTLCAVQLLCLLEYGTFCMTGTIGYGITNDTAMHNTGETGSTGTQRGNTTYGTTANQTTAMSYRGIENLYAHLFHVVDGINFNGLVPAIADHGFVDNTYTGTYTSTAITMATVTESTMSDILTSSTYDYVFFPGGGGATGGTHVGGIGYTGAGANGLLQGQPFNGGRSSPFEFTAQYYNELYGGYATVGSRLMYVG